MGANIGYSRMYNVGTSEQISTAKNYQMWLNHNWYWVSLKYPNWDLFPHPLSKIMPQEKGDNYQPMTLFCKYSKVALGRPLVKRYPSCSTVEIFVNAIFLLLIYLQNQIILVAEYLLRRINFGGKFLARINASALSLWKYTFIDGTPTGIPTAFPRDRVISITGNSSRQQ